jgi:Ser/Thr protein kinase RdoA (MazF antagonist)
MIRWLLPWILSSCAADEGDHRTGWLHSTLAADNRMMFERFPQAAAEKLAKMAATPFDFLRGTAAQFARDVLEPGPHHVRTHFGSAAASRRLLLGDAHLENVGTFYAGRVRRLVDFNDFDAAGFGPYHLDVWRLCVSIGLSRRSRGAGRRRDRSPRVKRRASARKIPVKSGV